jgi:hypothetical protein
MLFLFNYPQGTDFVGAFYGKESPNNLGYIDLNEAKAYYEKKNFDGTDYYAENEKLICFPQNYDIYDQAFKKFYDSNNPNYNKEPCITYDETIDY